MWSWIKWQNVCLCVAHIRWEIKILQKSTGHFKNSMRQMDDKKKVPYWNPYKIQSPNRTVALYLCTPDLRTQTLSTSEVTTIKAHSQTLRHTGGSRRFIFRIFHSPTAIRIQARTITFAVVLSYSQHTLTSNNLPLKFSNNRVPFTITCIAYEVRNGQLNMQLNLHCRPRCNVRTFNSSYTPCLGAPYGRDSI